MKGRSGSQPVLGARSFKCGGEYNRWCLHGLRSNCFNKHKVSISNNNISLSVSQAQFMVFKKNRVKLPEFMIIDQISILKDVCRFIVSCFGYVTLETAQALFPSFKFPIRPHIQA